MPEQTERIRKYGVLMCACMISTLPMIEARLGRSLAGLIGQGACAIRETLTPERNTTDA